MAVYRSRASPASRALRAGFFTGLLGDIVKKGLAYAFALAGFAATAQAADLDVSSIKDPLPDSLTWHGVTFYGTIDVGYAYQTNGRPLGAIVSDLEYVPFGLPTRNLTGQPISTLTGSALEQSKIGVKIEEEIGMGWAAVGKVDTGFDPMTGQLIDGCSSILKNAGIPYAQQTSNADSGRCGQVVNGVGYGGLSNKEYGTLTYGRQASLELDAIAAYDPMSLSYAFSFLGFSGINSGMGSTEAARWDNSFKYVYSYGPVHAAVMFGEGGNATGMFGQGYGANVGASYRGFSVDAVYTKENGAVNLSGANKNTLGATTLPAYISDNEAWTAVAKYTLEFGSGFKDDGACGGFKDAPCPPPSKLTFFGGYTHIDMGNPHSPVYSGDAAGGYPIAVSATSPDNTYFTTHKILQFFWTGAKYELPSGWSFTGAYYHVDQNSFVNDGNVCTAGGASRLNCSGYYDQGSFLIDYAFNKHLDVYAGITYARVADGLAAGFEGTPCGIKGVTGSCYLNQVSGTATSVDTFDFVTGVRLKF